MLHMDHLTYTYHLEITPKLRKENIYNMQHKINERENDKMEREALQP